MGFQQQHSCKWTASGSFWLKGDPPVHQWPQPTQHASSEEPGPVYLRMAQVKWFSKGHTTQRDTWRLTYQPEQSILTSLQQAESGDSAHHSEPSRPRAAINRLAPPAERSVGLNQGLGLPPARGEPSDTAGSQVKISHHTEEIITAEIVFKIRLLQFLLSNLKPVRSGSRAQVRW